MDGVVRIENGRLIDGFSAEVIENPALLIDRAENAIIGWGPAEKLEERMNRLTEAFIANGLMDRCDFVKIDLSKAELTVEQQAWIIRRCVEFSGSDFPNTLCNKWVDSDCKEWLEQQMNMVPLKEV